MISDNIIYSAKGAIFMALLVAMGILLLSLMEGKRIENFTGVAILGSIVTGPVSILIMRRYNQNEKRKRIYHQNVFGDDTENRLKQHNTNQTLFAISFILSLILTVLSLVPNYIRDNFSGGLNFVQLLFVMIMINSGSSKLPSLVYSKYQYYAAEACVKIGETKKNELDKAKYLIQSVYWYNKYLMKSLGLELSSLDPIYMKLIDEVNKKDNKFFRNLLAAFDKSDLEPLRVLIGIQREKSVTNNERNPIIFLTKYSHIHRIKLINENYLPILAIVISITGLIISK